MPPTVRRPPRPGWSFIRMGLLVKPITPEQLGQAVGSFAGLDVPAPAAPAAPDPIPESMMIFSGLRGSELDRTLSALLKAGVPPVGL